MQPQGPQKGKGPYYQTQKTQFAQGWLPSGGPGTAWKVRSFQTTTSDDTLWHDEHVTKLLQRCGLNVSIILMEVMNRGQELRRTAQFHQNPSLGNVIEILILKSIP